MDKIRSIAEIRAIIGPIARAYGAERIFLFGSYARGEARPDSDMDLRIDKGSIRGLRFAGLLGDLEEALGTTWTSFPPAGWTSRFAAALPVRRYFFMSGSERDLSILKHILSYCKQIGDAVELFGTDGDLFLRNTVYHNAIS